MTKLLNKAKPFLKNCFSYGTLFCGAELTQQLYIRKYHPTSQVKLYLKVRRLDYCNEYRTLQGLQTEKLDSNKLLHLSGWGYTIGKESFKLNVIIFQNKESELRLDFQKNIILSPHTRM